MHFGAFFSIYFTKHCVCFYSFLMCFFLILHTCNDGPYTTPILQSIAGFSYTVSIYFTVDKCKLIVLFQSK